MEQPKAQQIYRKSQQKKGLVRYELQVRAETKARFEAAVQAIADDYVTPWDPRRRLAKARAEVFDEMTRGIIHEFLGLKEQIASLRAEITALSPNFFKPKPGQAPPLPQAISTLQDDPDQLKNILANNYQELQNALRDAREAKRHAKQFEELYEANSRHNDDLQEELVRLKQQMISN